MHPGNTNVAGALTEFEKYCYRVYTHERNR